MARRKIRTKGRPHYPMVVAPEGCAQGGKKKRKDIGRHLAKGVRGRRMVGSGEAAPARAGAT